MYEYGCSKSIIGKLDMDRETGDVKIRAIFSRYHGNPTEQGVTLLRFYMDEEKVDALMDNGDVCVLASCAETSVFYHRDYGDKREYCFFDQDEQCWPKSLEEFFQFDWSELAPDTREGSALYLHTGGGWFIAPLGRKTPVPLYNEVIAHGKATGSFERLEDAPYFIGTDPAYPDSCSPEWASEREDLLSSIKRFRSKR